MEFWFSQVVWSMHHRKNVPHSILSNCELCHSAHSSSKSISAKKDTLKSFMTFHITPLITFLQLESMTLAMIPFFRLWVVSLYLKINWWWRRYTHIFYGIRHHTPGLFFRVIVRIFIEQDIHLNFSVEQGRSHASNYLWHSYWDICCLNLY